MKKLWGGAFSQEPDPLASSFGSSIVSDLVFWREDVECSIAHAQMLGEQKIIRKDESALLVKGLRKILKEGESSLPRDVEDIHTAIEVRLGELVGDVAGKLHTGRSRNDQVATSTRLYLRRRIVSIQNEIKVLQKVLLRVAGNHLETVLPGMTHQQHAQPVTLAFHMLSHFWALQRHGWRLNNLQITIGQCPLGSAALAGTSLPIDRQLTSKALGFDSPHPNALDATSDRSFVLDALHTSSLIMSDLSRMSQELIVWSMPEFGWLALPDSLTTGSSIMPQKRNPDMAELIRGRTGKAVGNYVACATVMKGLMMGYNRDTQDDKPPLFESLYLVETSLQLMQKMIGQAKWNKAAMASSTRGDFSTATDLADILVNQGMAFRVAHSKVGQAVRECQRLGISLDELTVQQAKKLGMNLSKSEIARLNPIQSALSRNSFGGTGKIAVTRQLKQAENLFKAHGLSKPW